MVSRISSEIDPKWRVYSRTVLARKFKRIRRTYKLTQKQFALASDVHINTISKAERYGNISTERLFFYLQIAKAAHKLLEQGEPLRKVTPEDAPFSEFKAFVATVYE